MILPDYELKIIRQNQSQLLYNIIFDKIIVIVSGDTKYKLLDIKFSIKDEYKNEDISLLKYLKSINDFLISNNYCIYDYNKKSIINMLDPNIVCSIIVEKLKITIGDIEYIKEKFPNLINFTTNECTILDKANIGVLNCRYMDNKSDIMTLNSFNGFSGRSLIFNESHIIDNNKNLIHLYNIMLKFNNVDINYETFILMLDAPNLRKLEIIRPKNKRLYNNDLLFISGLYNLESINVNATINSMEQIKKLERLREIRGILLDNQKEITKTKHIKEKYFNIIKTSGASDEELNNYLMYQAMILFNKYLDLQNELYVRRIDRVNWENKIFINDIERIKKELIEISKMFYKDRKKIARDIKKITSLEDEIDGLWFDKPTIDEEEYMINSKPFNDGGIDYYVKRKRIILDK